MLGRSVLRTDSAAMLGAGSRRRNERCDCRHEAACALRPHSDAVPQQIELARSTEAEKQSQLDRLAEFHARHAGAAPAMLKRLQQAVMDNANVFDVLMDAVRVCSLGQITNALFEVGGQYRRSM